MASTTGILSKPIRGLSSAACRCSISTCSLPDQKWNWLASLGGPVFSFDCCIKGALLLLLLLSSLLLFCCRCCCCSCCCCCCSCCCGLQSFDCDVPRANVCSSLAT
ncbi:unnamed protein product [Polarella glacialis]|uniref:Uncharacterized protein n=1 Tax=Polarella glacialis TaxID=89957 RepID=A0A813LAJ8_POLGL|nr:unnamed protein product [Polarella glacialis]CAE8719224.1 unnamed protein product [Polarella glacialis]